ncbi:MAG: hypothetical protein U5J83_02545 [Bryobacterales bacterium]|nr:hypothetical protein [Bryobacterales bacterium]
MEDNLLQVIVPAIGLVSGLIGAYVGLQNRALLAEVRQELAELENRIITRINGTYVRSSECKLREEALESRMQVLVERNEKRKAAGNPPAAFGSD